MEKHKMKFWLLGLLCFLAGAANLYAAAPTLDTIEGKAPDGTIFYVNTTTNITVVGTKDSTADVEVYLDGNPTGAVHTANMGTYSIDFSTAAGSHSIYIKETSPPLGNSPTFTLIVDTTAPTTTGVHWEQPADGDYVGLGLIKIYVTPSDGGSGVYWANSSISVPGITGSSSQSGADLIFTPTSGWPPAAGWTHNTLYTVNASIRDKAGNTTNTSEQFRLDTSAPSITLRWQNPNRTSAPQGVSYYMGEGLSRIWAAINSTVTESFGDAVDEAWTETNSSISPAPGGSGSWNYNPGTGEMDWTPLAHSDFTSGTTYTITIQTRDKALNQATATLRFRKDEQSPQITDVRTPDGTIFNDGSAGTFRVMRRANFPINTDRFQVFVTDNPADDNLDGVAGNETSLNAPGITNHSANITTCSVYYQEPAGEVSNNVTFTGLTGTTYRGDLTVAAGYIPPSGLYKG